MKAIVLERYGLPDGVQVRDVPRPQPGPNQLLVQVVAAAVNPMDYYPALGNSPVFRLIQGVRRPRRSNLGADVAGRVVAVGSAVTAFQVGDEVFGLCTHAFAEYVCNGASKFVHKPAGVSFEAAAAVPVTGLTALQGLRDKGKLRAGQRVLVNGASGGIGTLAVQMAHAAGAHVTGVCSTRNLDLVRSIGADAAIDYTRDDFSAQGAQYDLIYCTIGNRSLAAYRRALRPGGICVIAGFSSFPRLLSHIVGSRLVSRLGNKTVMFQGIAQSPQEDLQTLREMLASGQIAPVIDRRYPLSETGEALRYASTKRARGKVIIGVGAVDG